MIRLKRWYCPNLWLWRPLIKCSWHPNNHLLINLNKTSHRREINSIFKRSTGWLMKEPRSLLKKITMMRNRIIMEAERSSGFRLSSMKTINIHNQFPHLISYPLSGLGCLTIVTMLISSITIMEGWLSKNLKCSKILRLTLIICLPCTLRNTQEESRAVNCMVKAGLKWCKSSNSIRMRAKEAWVRWRVTESNSVPKGCKRRLSTCSLKIKNL